MSFSRLGRGAAVTVCMVATGACGMAAGPAREAAADPAAAPDMVVRVDTVLVQGDAALGPRVAALELQLLDRDAQLADLRMQLDDAIREVVRSMARLQTLATRAEAASAMAEAEVAVRQLRTRAGREATLELAQAQRLLEMSAAEFESQNYAGAVYLSTQAKGAASAGQGRLAGADGASLRPGEVRFAVPLTLEATARSNVREGPGSGFGVVFVLDSGARVTAYSYLDQWVRVTGAEGRSGWVFYNLLRTVK